LDHLQRERDHETRLSFDYRRYSGVLVSEFELTESAPADPDAFVAAIKQSIEDVEEQEP